MERELQVQVIQGKQSTIVEQTKEEKRKWLKNYKAREKTRLKKQAAKFYVLDTETTGFRRHGGSNELIQEVAMLYQQGKEAESQR